MQLFNRVEIIFWVWEAKLVHKAKNRFAGFSNESAIWRGEQIIFSAEVFDCAHGLSVIK